MSRLIDADALLEQVAIQKAPDNGLCCNTTWNDALNEATGALEAAPTLRCDGCKHGYHCGCRIIPNVHALPPDFGCSLWAPK